MTLPDDSFAHILLRRANSPNTADDVYNSKIQNKRLALLPTAPKKSNPEFSHRKPAKVDSRTLRRKRRNDVQYAKRQKQRNKPKPVSAKEVRERRLHALPDVRPENWRIYYGLHKMWCGYMRDALGISQVISSERAGKNGIRVTPTSAGAILASADYHGAIMEVVKSKCEGRVGLKGVVARDTKFTFVLCVQGGRFVTIPKEGTVFRFELPLYDDGCNGGDRLEHKRADPKPDRPEAELWEQPQSKPQSLSDRQPLVFEVAGDQFRTKASHRVGKKFKWHPPNDP